MFAECVAPNKIANKYRSACSMNKADLIDAITSEPDIPPFDAKSVLDSNLDTMTAALFRGESVEIRGLGCITSKNTTHAY